MPGSFFSSLATMPSWPREIEPPYEDLRAATAEWLLAAQTLLFIVVAQIGRMLGW